MSQKAAKKERKRASAAPAAAHDTKKQDEQKPADKPGDGKKPGEPKKIRTLDRPCLEMLDVELTEGEVRAYAIESARLHGDIENLERRKKDAMADFKAQVEAAKSRIALLNRRIETGKEQRQVDCVMRFFYDEGVKRLIRVIDGKEVELRTWPLLPEERRLALPMKDTLADKVNQAMERKTSGEPGKAPGAEGETGSAAESKETDQERAQAGVEGRESPEERKIRIFFNGLDSEGRKAFLGITEVNEDTNRILTLPYRRLKEADRELIRAAHGAKEGQERPPLPESQQEAPDAKSAAAGE